MNKQNRTKVIYMENKLIVTKRDGGGRGKVKKGNKIKKYELPIIIVSGM